MNHDATSTADSPRQQASQEQKRLAFAAAYSNLNQYLKTGDFFAAYVIAFSIVEDRLRAMYVLHYWSQTGEIPKTKKINQSISRIAKLLHAESVLPVELLDEFLELARLRNKVIHESIWRTGNVQTEDVKKLMVLGRRLDSITKKFPKKPDTKM
jgi:hypothetical protein